jgi:hypothetical protein
MRVNGQPRTSLLTTPDGQYPKAKRQETAAERERRARAAVGEGGLERRRAEPWSAERQPRDPRPRRALHRRAVRPPMFDGLYNNNHFFQMGTDHVAIVTEMIHDVRDIRLNSSPPHGRRAALVRRLHRLVGGRHPGGRDHEPAGSQAYRGAWQNLKVIERFTMVSPQRMNYRFEIVDPTMWDKPWGGEYEFVRGGPNVRIRLPRGQLWPGNILAGARAEDAGPRDVSRARTDEAVVSFQAGRSGPDGPPSHPTPTLTASASASMVISAAGAAAAGSRTPRAWR